MPLAAAELEETAEIKRDAGETQNAQLACAELHCRRYQNRAVKYKLVFALDPESSDPDNNPKITILVSISLPQLYLSCIRLKSLIIWFLL